MRNQTYNEIIRYFKLFAELHLDIERFAEEDEDQMSVLTSQGEGFPMLFVTPTGHSFDYDLNTFGFRVFCYDRVTKDRANNINMRSKTNQILNDFDVWLRKESELPFEIDSVTNVVPFSRQLMTEVTGWYIDIVIDNPSFSICAIPFSEQPQLPLGVCSVNEPNIPDPDSYVKVFNSSTDYTYNVSVPCGDRLYLPTENITVNGDLLANKKSVEDYDVEVVNSNETPITVDVAGGSVKISDSLIDIDGLQWSVMATDGLNMSIVDSIGNSVSTTQVGNDIVVTDLPIDTDFIVAAYNEGDPVAAAFVTVTGTVNNVIIDGLTGVVMRKNGLIISSLTNVTIGDVISFEFDQAIAEGVIIIEGNYA